ncbi:VC0807 family protein [Streptomyces sp. NRRL S-813]|uniref:VC0807 family protein n=1 Tax=Streptomyces sp. NRRL S-813 TaxID=1463919 RepID=UPI0004C0B16B|nr:VC0807 family protein [Streptomyces sp. NRRL S-813]
MDSNGLTAIDHPAPASRGISEDTSTGTSGAGRLGLLLDLGLSPGVFYGAQALGAGITASLLAATAAAGVRLVWTAARSRRIDGLNTLMLGCYALMLLLAVLARDERMLLARDPVSSALAGLVFLATCAAGTPALAYLSRRFHPAAGPGASRAPNALRFETAVWGVALTAEAAARFVLLFTLPVEAVPGVSTTVELGVIALLLPWTIRRRRRAAAVV